ncbi:protease synthase and sporulation negative regulatory protein PAI 1 [archaeon BMS3Abin17]|nr:protease synthase and sporulation negative regulatory protein PAI 1 [archaeon BMS3Abin17]HDZ60519.1 GNAT family N-acetyltransferase [Candidatus Pacearchaeota archaeon]
MEIRKANKKDFEELLKLILKCTIYHHELDKKNVGGKKLKRGSIKELKENETKILKEDLKNSSTTIFIAIKEKKIVGFITLSFPSKNANIKSKRGEINDLFILKEYRKKGIGKMLLKKALTFFRLKKVKLILLNVDSNNFSALKFYEKIGFKECMKRIGFYIE